MSYRVQIRIMPRPGLLDPQGQAIEHALTALAFTDATGVRAGKAISLDIEAASEAGARAQARLMCEKLLANPVTEDFDIEVNAR